MHTSRLGLTLQCNAYTLVTEDIDVIIVPKLYKKFSEIA